MSSSTRFEQSEFKIEEPDIIIEDPLIPNRQVAVPVNPIPCASNTIAHELLRSLSESEKKKHMKKRFQTRWIAEFEGIIRPNPQNENKFFCVVCNYEYSITTMGRAAVLTHMSTMTHQQNMKEYRERNQNLHGLFVGSQIQFHQPLPNSPSGSNSDLVLSPKHSNDIHTHMEEENNLEEVKKLKDHVERLNQQVGRLNNDKMEFQRKSLHFEAMYHREVAKNAILEGELVGYKNACQKLQEALDKMFGLNIT